jgi:hypothetical protein
MERTAWTDDRIGDALVQLREEMRAGFADIRAEMRAGFADLHAENRQLRSEVAAEFGHVRSEFGAETRSIRAELFQLKIFMLAGLVTILAAVIALHG